MQSSKIENLSSYNKLIKTALKASYDFPEILSDFLVSEYELSAVVLFKVNDDNLVVLGKSASAKKAYTKNSVHKCKVCTSLKTQPSAITLNSQPDCELQTSDFVLYESCLFITLPNGQKILLKIAQKSPFSKADHENFLVIGESVSHLLSLWMGDKLNTSTQMSEIVTNIAHELRTPTNSIMGFASLLNEESLTPSQSEYVITLKENAYNLLSLINDLVDLAKLESGSTKDTAASVNPKNFVEEILKLISEKIDKSKIDFMVDVEENVNKQVKFDTQKLRYVINNVIAVSLRQMDSGKITISVSMPSADRLNFRISDTSAGIPSAKLKDIFKPFVPFELGTNKIAGTTGLGLALTKKYIEYLNGTIDISSSVGKGSTYNFSISTESMTAIESQISALPKPGKKNSVLVVEDDYATSKLLSNYLNKWGYEPTIVNSAEQALKIIERESFLAILLDVVLPDANGLELLKEIREKKNAKHTPVIICSVEAEQQKAFLMGAVEYFVKPIQYQYLVEVLTSYKLKKDSNILIVDDDIPTLNLIREAVEQAGFNAVAESHSSKVESLIEGKNLDLAIIDLDMPELNGFELIKLIKTKPEFKKLPVIIYTGKENYKEDLKKIDGMFEELLEKSSSNIEDLAETINAMINRYDEPSTPEEVVAKKDAVKILLVEDYKHSQIIVTRLLKKNNFDSIVVVENGLEALEEAKVHKYNLILMDMQMPVMNGFEATEKIRLLPGYKDTPIIALTAFAMKGDREKCLDAGATDYIPKPIDSQEFIEKVKFYTESKVKV
ncbi:MAG: response regulator [Ignavibacteriales bacterium]|nr:MAG: response regulator [Ignavibacteriales bacterium]